MTDIQEMLASSQVQTRQMIKDIGRTVIETLVTAEDELLAQGGQDARVQDAILTGTVNALGAYVATRLYPEPDQLAAAAHVQAGLQQALVTLRQARRGTRSMCETTRPTDRTRVA